MLQTMTVYHPHALFSDCYEGRSSIVSARCFKFAT